MKLDAFITTVLLDINSGLRQAKEETGKEYHVGVPQSDGVISFDIAVTSANSTNQK